MKKKNNYPSASSCLIVGLKMAKLLKPIISPMTHKELKRASYIYAKEKAGVILTESEQEFIDLNRNEYEQSEMYQHTEEMSDEDAKALKERFKIPDSVDTKEFFKQVRLNMIRKKFANKLKPEAIKPKEDVK